MTYMKRRRVTDTGLEDNDPLSGVANLFDLGLVFIVGLLITLFSAYQLTDLFSRQSEMTLMKKGAQGQWEILIKKGKKIKAMKVSQSTSEGRGEKLGTAYRLENGTVVYVPEMEE
ncbi:DUF2149 domain-containing protein [Desulfoferrobacter suflitae]|uniref:DUF2149 domain-containing protein n=1 Tax=Desulfoferrobacter suflitae TaxID=2865782 RepID=UPI002164E08B|nr:DUF2149 domain-containing protein [Desulfoferrobacter suflitae]MCK8604339.1 DUF2149 domain-containing protein [Desulfoferrobacter suflitae]